jgi:broad specificity phosphatase PhoE
VLKQARAAGEALSNTHFSHIYASPLLRALTTAQAICDAQPEPKPPLTTSLLLREQHWGEAEGRPWILEKKPGLTYEEHFAQDLWPVMHERWEKFPSGESLEDVVQRAEQAIAEFVMPHVWEAARQGKKGVHIAIVSHGICISELIPVLVMKDASGEHPGHRWRGLLNTAWTRVTVNVKVSE